MTAQDPFNNIARTTLEALAAAFGGTQSLHTNSLDEAIALPTDFSAGIARDTQKYLQHENTGITKAIDPWAGSNYVEYLTGELIKKAKVLIEEVESVGGMAEAIVKGIPKRRIEEAATAKQGRIDSSYEKIIGVNLFPVQNETLPETLSVSNDVVRATQCRRLEEIKAKRDEIKVKALLKQLENAGDKNLLDLAIEAARARCTLGEISYALEKSFGRYQANIQSIQGIYRKTMESNEEFIKARKISELFESKKAEDPEYSSPN